MKMKGNDLSQWLACRALYPLGVFFIVIMIISLAFLASFIDIRAYSGACLYGGRPEGDRRPLHCHNHIIQMEDCYINSS